MSRLYEMAIEIRHFDVMCRDEIVEAARREWPFGLEGSNNTVIQGDGEDVLYGGESEEEFSERLAKAIWAANHGFCPVIVRATYLEDLPFEEYFFTEEKYEELMSEKKEDLGHGES